MVHRDDERRARESTEAWFSPSVDRVSRHAPLSAPERTRAPDRSGALETSMQLGAAYWQAGAPSVVAGVWAVVFPKIAQVPVGLVWVMFVIGSFHPPPFAVGP